MRGPKLAFGFFCLELWYSFHDAYTFLSFRFMSRAEMTRMRFLRTVNAINKGLSSSVCPSTQKRLQPRENPRIAGVLVVEVEGFEPTTRGLRVLCSAY